MAIVSGAGLIATAIGIFLVWGTLGQSKVATKAAQDAVSVTEKMGRMQTQAYISFSGTELFYIAPEGVIIGVQVRPQFKNTGQSPGTIVYGFCDICFRANLESALHHFNQRYDQYRMKLNIGPGEKRWIASSIVPIDKISRATEDGSALIAIGRVEFIDVYDDERRVEDFCVAIAFHSDPSKMNDGIPASHHWNALQNFSIKIA